MIGFAQQERLLAVIKKRLLECLGIELLQAITHESHECASQELLVATHSILAQEQFAALDRETKDVLAARIIDEILGLGVLEPYLRDETVSEIMVNGANKVFVERAGRLEPVNDIVLSNEQIRILIDRIIAPLGRRLDESHPIVNARLASGDRVNAVIPPLSLDGPTLNIRKFLGRISHMDELVRKGSLPQWFAQVLSWCVRGRLNIAVVGSTGSGKTTLLNALSCQIDQGERIITIEDAAELQFLTHPHVVRLEAREASAEGVGAVTIRDLVINALRMRPDRIVVGEVRSAEAIDMLQAMNTGHDGSLTTLHAGTAHEALNRLVMMCRYGTDLDPEILEEQVASALDLIVIQRRLSSGRRLVCDLVALVSNDEQASAPWAQCAAAKSALGMVGFVPLVTYDAHRNTWVCSPVLESFLTEKIVVPQIALGEEVSACLQSASLR